MPSLAMGCPIETHRCPLDLLPIEIQYLKDCPAAKDVITDKLKSEGFICTLDLENSTIDMFVFGENSVKLALQIIKESIFVEDVPEKTNVRRSEADELEPRVVELGSVVKLVGLRDSLRKGRFSSKLEPAAKKMTEKVVQMSKDCFSYLLTYQWQNLVNLIRELYGYDVTLQRGKHDITLLGPASAVASAADSIREEVEQVKTFDIYFEQSVNVAKIAAASERIRRRHECVITYQQNFGAAGTPHRLEDDMPSLSLDVSGIFVFIILRESDC